MLRASMAQCEKTPYCEIMSEVDRVILDAKLRYHIREHGQAVAPIVALGQPSGGWRYKISNHNYTVNCKNAEFHERVVGILAAQWLELTSEHYPLGFWLETRDGGFDRYGKKIIDVPVAKPDGASQ